MVKIKGGNEMKKHLKSLAVLSAAVLIGIAESSINMMCAGFMDEIELPEEMKNTEF
ncbi:hypothetical protein CWD94_18080 [Lysinibacillus xylanilyticus]|uniref:Cyclic lactone autoinducer peptide n=1 Tax=Lysinibacillus xylanilyticus TaxID=582475 RepID=A0A2M9Q2S3_9BACI|nr:hypothetical protein CWD94_18080 [Lysinibacillus xylanilyticus]